MKKSDPNVGATVQAEPATQAKGFAWRKWAPIGGVGIVLILGIAVWSLKSKKPPRVSGFNRAALRMLQDKDVQEELILTEDQKMGITHLQADQQRAFEGKDDISREEREDILAELARTNEAEIKKLLDEGQMIRLHQIY